jgi:6-phosphogluconolactonase (cycloisomerase 2 family)
MKSGSETGCERGANAQALHLAQSARRAAVGRGKLPFALLTAALLLGVSACDNDYTLGYVYAPSASTTAGLINAYGIDNQTGHLRLLADSPIPSGGRNPTAIAAIPHSAKNHGAIYVSNHDDSNVVALTIGTDGKLYPQETENTTGSFPTALAVSADGTLLYVAYTYQNQFTTASPGPGGISVFSINSDYSIGPQTDPSNPTAPSKFPNAFKLDFPIGRAPVALAASTQGDFLYVVSQDKAALASGATQTSNLFAFQFNTTSNTLTALPGQTINTTVNVPSFGYPSGQLPGGVLEDASASHLYVTDTAGNAIISYSIGSNGVPTQIGSAPTGVGPRGMTIDPSGKYLYVANYTDGTVGGYTFDGNGVPVQSTVALSTATGPGTSCVTIEPTHGIYLYSSGTLSNTIAGEQLIQADGSLKPIIGSPYEASTLPTCAVSVARF